MRRLAKLLAVLAFSAAMSLAIVWAKTRGLREELLANVEAVASARYERAAHVPAPLPGSFGELAGPALAELKDVSWCDLPAPVSAECVRVIDAEASLAALPAQCSTEVARYEQPVRALLLATHAQEGGVPAATRSLSTERIEEGGLVPIAEASALGALLIRQELAEGNSTVALFDCLDLMALARDARFGGGYQGVRIAAYVSDMALKPCAAAIDSAPSGVKQEAARATSTDVPAGR